MKSFRPTAVPLITCDPYFSVWSFSDQLNEDKTRHWTGCAQSMYGVLSIDGKPHCFMGKLEVLDRNSPEEIRLKQTSVTVTPTSSIYTFSHPVCDFRVTFLTPLLLDKPEIFSRPVSYVFYEIIPKEEGHRFEVYLDASAQLTGDIVEQDFVAKEKPGHVSVGNAEQRVLNRCGDDVRIDWGYLHLVHPNAHVNVLAHRLLFFKKRVSVRYSKFELDKPISSMKLPILYAVSDQLKDCFVIAYDDVKSILYHNCPVDAYYKTVYGSFEAMLDIAVREANDLRSECEAFDKRFVADMKQISPEYAKIGSLAYRQAISAHKLVLIDGQLMFFSKENFSNGCMATLDVTYPSIPLFLLFNPELVRAMMRPLFAYARTKEWKYRYAPHDCGCYPFCNGQVYSTDRNGVLNEERQMPVEECGNAILVMSALLKTDGKREYLEENRDLLKQWAEYLVEYGYDPGNQLCTDDFAGHQEHNCNLSLKAIVALGAYARMFDEPKYALIAKEFARKWSQDARRKDGMGYRLSFDREDSWSLKYNLVWDRLLGLNLFDGSVGQSEIALYREHRNRYGTPLDCRANYTKLDWLAWTTVLTDDKEYLKEVYRSISRMICESTDRVPITDWYDSVDAKEMDFQARSVLGGFYINLFAKHLKEINKKEKRKKKC